MEFNSSIVDEYEYRFNGIDIPYRGYWNLNAKLIIGDSRGYLFIKTDTKTRLLSLLIILITIFTFFTLIKSNFI